MVQSGATQVTNLCHALQDDYLRKSAQKGNEKAVKKLLRAGVPADPRKPHHTVSPGVMQC